MEVQKTDLESYEKSEFNQEKKIKTVEIIHQLSEESLPGSEFISKRKASLKEKSPIDDVSTPKEDVTKIKKKKSKPIQIEKTNVEEEKVPEIIEIEPKEVITTVPVLEKHDDDIVPEKIDEQVEETKLSKKPAEQKKSKLVKKKAVKSNDDAELERLLNLEVGKTELEQYEKIDIEIQKPKRLETEVLEPNEPLFAESEIVIEDVNKLNEDIVERAEAVVKKSKKVKKPLDKPTVTEIEPEELNVPDVEKLKVIEEPEMIETPEKSPEVFEKAAKTKKIKIVKPSTQELIETPEKIALNEPVAPTDYETVSETLPDVHDEANIIIKDVIEDKATINVLEPIEIREQSEPDDETESVSEGQPVKKTIKKTKKKTKKVVDENDEILRKLLEFEVPKTELEKYEKVDFETKKKLEEDEATPIKLTPMKIERKQIKPTKLIVSEPVQIPQQIQLKKTKVAQKKHIEESKLPTVLLKSRIMRIDYPPETQFSEFIELDVHMYKGVLSRNSEEVEEVQKKKKVKKFKPSKKENVELEKLDLEESEEESIAEPVEEPEKQKYERQPKKIAVEEEPETKVLKLGKGKLPKEESTTEDIKLKKTPKKIEEPEEVELKVKTKKEIETPEKIQDKPKRTLEGISPPLPIDIPDSEPVELERIEHINVEKPEVEKIKPKTKHERTKKIPVEPESPSINIVLGKPKEPEEVLEVDVKFRIPESKKPEEGIEQIKLKPFVKPETKEEEPKIEPVYELAIKFDDRPASDDEEISIKSVDKKPKKKTKKPKPKSFDADDEALQRLLNLEVGRTELEKYEKVDVEFPKKEKPEMEVQLPMIPEKAVISESVPVTKVKEPIEEKPVEKVIKLEKPKRKESLKKIPENEPLEDESLENILKKKLKSREALVKEEIIVGISDLNKPQFPKHIEAAKSFEAELEQLKRRLSKPISVEGDSETSEPKSEPRKKTLKKKKRTSDLDQDAIQRLLDMEVEKTELEQYEKGDLDLNKREKVQVTYEPVPFQRAVRQSSEEEEVSEKVFKIRKVSRPIEEPEEASISFRKPIIKDEPVPESATFALKKTQFVTEDVEVEQTIKKQRKPKHDEAEIEFSIKKTKKTKKTEEFSADATITMAQEIEEIEELDEEEPAPESATFALKKKPKKMVTEDIEVEQTIKKQRKPKHDEAETEFSIKKTKKPRKIEEFSADATITMAQEIEEIEEEPEEEDIAEEVVFRRKSKPKIIPKLEEHTDEFTIKKLKPPRRPSREPEMQEVENVTFRPKRTTTKEDVEQEFKIKLDSYAEEEISMSGKVKLRKPKPVYSEEADEHNIRIIQEIDDEEGPIIEEIIDDDDSEHEDTMYDVDEPDEFSENETIPEDLPEHVLFKLKRKKHKVPYQIQDYEEESVSLGLPKKKRQPKTTSYEEDSLQLRLKKKHTPKYYEGKIETNISLNLIVTTSKLL